MTTILISALSGAILVAGLFVLAMRLFMIRPHKMNATFNVVCEKIEESLKVSEGWVHPIPFWDMFKAVSKSQTFNNIKNGRVYFICKAKYANRITDRFPHMGAMMPCAWAVYETIDGQVYLAKMNIGLMSKIFIGNVIGNTMSKVAREEHVMLKELERLVKS